MMNPTASSSQTGPGIDKLKADLQKLMNMDVLVGVTEDESIRKNTETGETVNNAQLVYLHTNGSDLQGIPKRPIIEPAIEAHKEEISVQLKKVAEFALDGRPDKALTQLKKVGMLGQNVCRDWFLDARNGWPPNSPATIKEKLSKSHVKILKQAAQYVDEGGSLSDITGLEGATRVLIDTAQMRRAISYTIRQNK